MIVSIVAGKQHGETVRPIACPPKLQSSGRMDVNAVFITY